MKYKKMCVHCGTEGLRFDKQPVLYNMPLLVQIQRLRGRVDVLDVACINCSTVSPVDVIKNK